MIRFVGSVYFALILIASVAIIVISGTFLESYTSSHLFAARLTYGNPLFAVLLWLFFLNIFVSTLLRWPFKRRHIPFIITHLGLLMILGGQLVKHYYGTQGVMQIAEGCSTCEYFIEHSEALEITDREGVKKSHLIDRMAVDTPDIKIVNYHPNGSEELRGWIYQGKARIDGLPPLEVENWEPNSPLPKGVIARLHHPQSTPWHLFAIKTDHLDRLIEELKPMQPYLILLEKEQEPGGSFAEAIWVSAGGTLHRDELDSSLTIAMYDGGRSGYATSLEIPFSNLPDTPESKREALLHSLTVELRILQQSNEPLPPPLKALSEGSVIAEVNFEEAAIAFLDEWDKSNEYIMTQRASSEIASKAINSIKRESLEYQLQEIAPHLISATKQLSKEELFSVCCKAYGLELKNFSLPDTDKMVRDYYAARLFCENARLAVPKISNLSLNERIAFIQAFPLDAEDFVALRNAYKIYLQSTAPETTLPNFVPALANIVDAMRLLNPLNSSIFEAVSSDFTYDKARLESPLIPIRKPISELLKIEEQRPIATFELNNGTGFERFTLVYDPYGTGLRWPIQKGDLLARFQPHFVKLPHTLKLRQARQINYANTNQPYSYEADLWIEPQHELITLSMNQVYETSDGYRFYLSGISPTSPEAWKKVQIVVNRDPGKYVLTYSGAILLMFGASLLFFFRKQSSK